MSGPSLVVEDLSVAYGAQGAEPVLTGVDLRVDPGEVVAVLGRNGAGKTTLLRAISGLLSLHGGHVVRGRLELEGRSILGRPAPARVRAGMVAVLEGHRVFADLTVAENLALGSHVRRDRQGISTDRRRVLELFPALEPRLGLAAGHLSGGEQQQVSMARALMARPRVVLLDEPSLGLSPRLVDSIGDVVAELAQRGVAVVLVEQHAAMALAVSRRAYVLDGGRVALEGGAADLAADERVRALYLGQVRRADPGPRG